MKAIKSLAMIAIAPSPLVTEPTVAAKTYLLSGIGEISHGFAKGDERHLFSMNRAPSGGDWGKG